jgi:hypothetical protein
VDVVLIYREMKNIKTFESYSHPNYGAQNRNTGDLAGKKQFTDAEIQYYEKLWNWLNVRHHNNKFFSNMWDKLKTKKELTKRQWLELEFLLKNGKSRYESGQLPNNY